MKDMESGDEEVILEYSHEEGKRSPSWVTDAEIWRLASLFSSSDEHMKIVRFLGLEGDPRVEETVELLYALIQYPELVYRNHLEEWRFRRIGQGTMRKELQEMLKNLIVELKWLTVEKVEFLNLPQPHAEPTPATSEMNK